MQKEPKDSRLLTETETVALKIWVRNFQKKNPGHTPRQVRRAAERHFGIKFYDSEPEETTEETSKP